MAALRHIKRAPKFERRAAVAGETSARRMCMNRAGQRLFKGCVNALVALRSPRRGPEP